MALFDPWMLGGPGGILANLGRSYNSDDIEKLIGGYPSRWSDLPPADAPQAGVPGNSSLGPQAWNSPLMPRATSVFSTEGAPATPQAPGGQPPWITFRPGSVLDKMFNTPGTVEALGNPPAPGWVDPGRLHGPSTNPADYAHLADAFGPAASRPLPMNVSGSPPPVPTAGMSRFEPFDVAEIPGALAGGARLPANSNQAQDATLPPGATPTQGTAPPQYAQQQMPQPPDVGFGDRFTAGVNNLSSGGNPIAMLANVAQGFATGRRFDKEGVKQQNQATIARAVAQSLIAQGYPPQVAVGMAQAASIDPKIAEKILGDAYAIPKTAEEMAVRQSAGVGMSGRSKTNPFDIIRQKNAAEKAGTTEGERVATAQIDLPGAVAQANEALRLVQELRTHKGREGNAWWHSKVGAYLPDSSIPGNTDARDALGILNQIKGGAFLEAFKALKGGGQITEVEGKKATDAIARMERSQSKAEFDRALSDFEGIIKLGVDRASQVAGQPPPNNFQGNTGWQQVKPGVRIRQVQ